MHRVRGYWEFAIWMQLDGYLSYKGIEPSRHLAREGGRLNLNCLSGCSPRSARGLTGGPPRRSLLCHGHCPLDSRSKDPSAAPRQTRASSDERRPLGNMVQFWTVFRKCFPCILGEVWTSRSPVRSARRTRPLADSAIIVI